MLTRNRRKLSKIMCWTCPKIIDVLYLEIVDVLWFFLMFLNWFCLILLPCRKYRQITKQAQTMSKVHCLHFLIKTTDSRNPISRRTSKPITLTPEVGRKELAQFRDRLLKIEHRALEQAFRAMTKQRSDCGSFACVFFHFNSYHHTILWQFNIFILSFVF